MSRIGLGISATVIIIGLVAGAYAQNTIGSHDPFMGLGGPGWRGDLGRFGGRGGPLGVLGPLGPMMARQLNLSDAQKERFKSIQASHRDDMKALGDRAMAAHQALEAAVTAETFDEVTIRSRSSEVAAVGADMAVARARIRAEVLQVLTAEQQAQLKQMQAQMQQRAEHRRQRMEGGSTTSR
jgi:Spy/CpxP family protein refolding chaperone